MSDASRAFMSQWRLEESQARLANASEDADVRWRSAQNVANRWQKQEIVREFDVENVYSSEAVPTWLSWACTSDKERSVTRSAQPDEAIPGAVHKSNARVTAQVCEGSVHNKHKASKLKDRPQSATTSRHPITRDSDFAAAVSKSTNRSRPQSAKLLRPQSASRRSTVEQTEDFSTLIPQEMQRSKWTEMLFHSPSFQQSSLIKLEQETYNLLQSVFKRERVRAASSHGRPTLTTKQAKKTARAKHERVASTLLTPTHASTVKKKPKRGPAFEIPRGSGLQMARNKHRETPKDMPSSADPHHQALQRCTSIQEPQSAVLNQLDNFKCSIEHSSTTTTLSTTECKRSKWKSKTKIRDKALVIDDDEAIAHRERVFQEIGWDPPEPKSVRACGKRVHKRTSQPQLAAQGLIVLKDPIQKPDPDKNGNATSHVSSPAQTIDLELLTEATDRPAGSTAMQLLLANQAFPPIKEQGTNAEQGTEESVEKDFACKQQDPTTIDSEAQLTVIDLQLVNPVDSTIGSNRERDQIDEQAVPGQQETSGENDPVNALNNDVFGDINAFDLKIDTDLELCVSPAKQKDCAEVSNGGATVTPPEQSLRDMSPLATFDEPTCITAAPSHFMPTFTEDIEAGVLDWSQIDTASSKCGDQVPHLVDPIHCEGDAQVYELSKRVDQADKLNHLEREHIRLPEEEKRSSRASEGEDLEIKATVGILDVVENPVAANIDDEDPRLVHDTNSVHTETAANGIVSQDTDTTVLESPHVPMPIDVDEISDAALPTICLDPENELHEDQVNQDDRGSNDCSDASTSDVCDFDTTAECLQSSGVSSNAVSSGHINEEGLESRLQCDGIHTAGVGVDYTNSAPDVCEIVHDVVEAVFAGQFTMSNDHTQDLISEDIVECSRETLPSDAESTVSTRTERSAVEVYVKQDTDDAEMDMETSDRVIAERDKESTDLLLLVSSKELEPMEDEPVCAQSPVQFADTPVIVIPENTNQQDPSDDAPRNHDTDRFEEAREDFGVIHELEPLSSPRIKPNDEEISAGYISSDGEHISSDGLPTPSTITICRSGPSVEEVEEAALDLEDPMPDGFISASVEEDGALQTEDTPTIVAIPLSSESCSAELPAVQQVSPSMEMMEVSNNLETILKNDPCSNDSDATTNGNLVHLPAIDSSPCPGSISGLRLDIIDPPSLSSVSADNDGISSTFEPHEWKTNEELEMATPALPHESETSSSAARKIQRQYRRSVQRQILVEELRFMLSQHHRQIRKKTRREVGALKARKSSTSDLVIAAASATNPSLALPIPEPVTPRHVSLTPDITVERAEFGATQSSDQGTEPCELLGSSDDAWPSPKAFTNEADQLTPIVLDEEQANHSSNLESSSLNTESKLEIPVTAASCEDETSSFASPCSHQAPDEWERRPNSGIDSEQNLTLGPAEERAVAREVLQDDPSQLNSAQVLVESICASDPSNNEAVLIVERAGEAASHVAEIEGDSDAKEFIEAAGGLLEIGYEWESLEPSARQEEMAAVNEGTVGSLELESSVVLDTSVKAATDFVAAASYSSDTEGSDAILRARAASVALAALAFDDDDVDIDVDASAILLFPNQTEDPSGFASAPDVEGVADRVGYWERYMDSATSKSYYFNPLTQVSQWTAPEDGSQILDQAAVGEISSDDVWYDETSFATAQTDPTSQQPQQPVLLESFGGWDQYIVPDTGAVFYYHEDRREYAPTDGSDAEPPVEFLAAKAACLQQQTGSANAAAETGDSAVELEWQAFTDAASQQTFYYNARTGVSTWEPPPCVDGVSGVAYYVDAETGETSWEKSQAAAEDDDEYVIRIDEHAAEM